MEIIKRQGTNIIDTIQEIKDLVAEEQKNFPLGVEVVYSEITQIGHSI